MSFDPWARSATTRSDPRASMTRTATTPAQARPDPWAMTRAATTPAQASISAPSPWASSRSRGKPTTIGSPRPSEADGFGDVVRETIAQEGGGATLQHISAALAARGIASKLSAKRTLSKRLAALPGVELVLDGSQPAVRLRKGVTKPVVQRPKEAAEERGVKGLGLRAWPSWTEVIDSSESLENAAGSSQSARRLTFDAREARRSENAADTDPNRESVSDISQVTRLAEYLLSQPERGPRRSALLRFLAEGGSLRLADVTEAVAAYEAISGTVAHAAVALLEKEAPSSGGATAAHAAGASAEEESDISSEDFGQG